MIGLITAWRRRRLQAKVDHHLMLADGYRAEARRLALEAYDVPDMMATPMHWARLQSAANWAKHREAMHRKAATRIEKEIACL